MDAKPFKPELREAALQIYVALAAREVQVSPDGVSMTASAENLARLAFKLSSVFQQVQDDLNRENMPKNAGFVMSEKEVAAWSAGILILIMPRLLNFIVAIYLIAIGVIGLLGGVKLG